jgi:chromosomal replication initiator protein
LWQTALGEIQVQVNKPNFRTWFEKTSGVSYRDNRFIISVPNTFVAEYLEKNQRSLIEKTLIGLLHTTVEVEFRVNGECGAPDDAGIASPPLATAIKTECSRLNPRYTFDTFVVGESNRMAYAAAAGIASSPGHSYNPLFIYGGTGLGKSHLLHAIGHAAREKGVDVVFATAEQFTNDFIKSIREKKTEGFRDHYRNAGMLLVDDIQFICGKEQTEESFFHTFNELHNASRQIAVTCDCPPRSVPVMEERLRSRFEWGLTTCIELPDRNTRISILQSKATRDGLTIAPEVLELIAGRNQHNIRELEGSLNRVIAYARLLNIPPTLQIAEKAITDIASKQPDIKAPPTPDYVLKMVADAFQSTVDALKSHKRDRQVTLARQVAMYLIRQHSGFSFERIGKELGNREPISVSNACKKIIVDLQTNSDLKQKVSALEQKISPASGG